MMIGINAGKKLLVGVLAATMMLVPAAFAPVFADGSGPISPFPTTGAFSAFHKEDRDNISIIEFAGDYNRDLPSGAANVEPRAVVAKEFFRTHPDNYDFIIVFSTFEFETAPARAFHWAIQNKVQGIGLPQFDVSNLFGSQSKLQGYVDMAALTRWKTDALDPEFEDTLSVLGHEVLHQWASFVKFKNPDGTLNEGLLGRNNAHWSFLLDSDASVEEGNEWQDNGDGTFTSVGTFTFFSPLDLYLMGMYKPEEVPPFFLIDNPNIDKTQSPQENITISGTKQTMTIDDIIAAEGPRVPAADQSQKDFRFAFVLLTGPNESVTDAQILALNNIRNAFMTRFAILTGGRGIAQAFPEALPTESTGAPTEVVGGNVRVDPASITEALAWLRGKQDPLGFWNDKDSTQIRDTAVTLQTLQLLDPGFNNSAPALKWLSQQTISNTDYLARFALTLDETGSSAASQLSELTALQNSDGGWGIKEGYASDPLDTALSVLALTSQGNNASAVAGAMTYLVNSQNVDGGWSGAQGGPSRTLVTATVTQAFKAGGQESNAALTPALAWLAGKQNVDGGFGDSPSTAHDTALVLISFIQLDKLDQIASNAAASFLLNTQSVEGSWNGSTYTTSLAAAALRRFNFPNWAVSTPLVATPVSPRDGERVKVTVTVTNNASLATDQGILRLFDGAPESGGTQIGTDIVIPPMASSSSLTFTPLWDTFGKPGAHTVVAIVDQDGTSIEMSERDNRASVDVQVQAAPNEIDLDLAAPDITVIPALPNTLPTTLGINVNLRNLGKTDAPNVRVVLWDGDPNTGTLIGETTADVLNRSTMVANFNYVLTRAGTTRFTVQLDPDNTITEANETNNQAFVEITTLPSVDLVVTNADIAADINPVLFGDDVTFTVNLHNNGTLDTPSTTVKYFVTDGNVTKEIGNNVIQLKPGETTEQKIIWRVDLTGNLTFTAQLDSDNLVPELDETNNTGSLALTSGTANGPNLAVNFNDFTFTPNPGNEGLPLTLSALVRNTGSQVANAIDVAFYDGDPANGGTRIGTTQTIATLAAGAETTVSFLWNQIPDSTDKLMFVVVDEANTIVEFSESDNIAFNILPVLSLPDLAISSGDISLNPAFPKSGDTVAITARVSNLGQQAASNVVIRAFDGDPAAGGVLIGEQTLATVAGNSAVLVNFSQTFPMTSTARPIVVQIDPDGLIQERFRANNAAQRNITVQDGNFNISNPFFSPNGDGVKDDTEFNFRLSAAATVKVEVVNASEEVIRTFSGTNLDNTSTGTVVWDGLDDKGRLASDSDYLIRVVDTAGTSLGDVAVNLDTNRSSLLKAIDTKNELFTNMSCELPNINDLSIANDEQNAFFRIGSGNTPDVVFPKGVYNMQSNGTDIRPIVPEGFFGTAGFVQKLITSKDGSKLVFVKVDNTLPVDQRLTVWVVGNDGKNLINLSAIDLHTIFAIAPDGSAIYSRENSTIYRTLPVANAVPEALVTMDGVTGSEETARLSPTGTHLAFTTFNQLYLLDISTKNAVLLESISRYSEKFRWSPDGSLLAVASNDTRQVTVYDALGNTVNVFPVPDTITLRELGEPSWSSSSDELSIAVRHDPCAGGGGGFPRFVSLLGIGTANAIELINPGTGSVEPGGVFIANILTGEFTKVAEIESDLGLCFSYHISTWDGKEWKERGQLHYDRFYIDQQLDLTQFLPDADGEYKVRISQNGKEAAHVESVALVSGSNRYVPKYASRFAKAGIINRLTSFIKDTRSTENVLEQIKYPDNEVLDLFESEMEVGWAKFPAGERILLSLNAREEELSKLNALPFDYLKKDKTPYSYTLQKAKPLIVDGKQEANDNLNAPLFKSFSRPDTGHPYGNVYGYVTNDDNYLYAALDFTVDNTMDGDLDWASLRVKVNNEWKDFKITVKETKYGQVGFIHTDKVSYTHKYYEFKVPLADIDAEEGNTIEVMFQAYGTAAKITGGPLSGSGTVLPFFGEAIWAPGERSIVYDAQGNRKWAIFLDEGNTIQPIFQNWPSDFNNTEFLPSGRKLLFQSNRAAIDPSSICFQQGFSDYWSFESLLNLVADLRATRSSQSSGVILRGTATDLNFDTYLLEYTPIDNLNGWQPVTPASGQPVIDDVFTTWVPPAPGNYLVRLTVSDQAGNSKQSIKRVAWSDSVSITDLQRTPNIISPNGDGIQDGATISYTVLEPVHLEFNFFNSTGDLVRTIVRDHSMIGAQFSVIWDGRDNAGLTVPDGDYRMTVQNFEFGIVVDATPPSVGIRVTDAYQPLILESGGTIVDIKPELFWNFDDEYFNDATIEFGLGANPTEWTEVTDPDIRSKLDTIGVEQSSQLGRQFSSRTKIIRFSDRFTNKRYRLRVTDKAGNSNIIAENLGAEQLILARFGNFELINESEGSLSADLSDASFVFKTLDSARFVPLGDESGGTDISAVINPSAIRAELVETIRNPLVELNVQFKEQGQSAWNEVQLNEFITGIIGPTAITNSIPTDTNLNVRWLAQQLTPGKTHIIRFRAKDSVGQEHFSNSIKVTVGGFSFRGLVDINAPRIDPPLENDEYGFWGTQLLGNVEEVQLFIQSDEDPRYAIAQQIDSAVFPKEAFTFRTKALDACKKYNGFIVLLGPVGADGNRIELGRTDPLAFRIPCIDLTTKTEVISAQVCNSGSPNKVSVKFAPHSLDGSELKLLTLSRIDPVIGEDVVFNVNKPEAVPQQPPGIDPNFRYEFELDTTNLPESEISFMARLINVDDIEVTKQVKVTIDHTPPVLTIGSPIDGQKVCGIPRLGADGITRNIVGLDGAIQDNNGFHYQVDLIDQVTSETLAEIHDSRTDRGDSIRVASGIKPNPEAKDKPDHHINRQFSGTLAELFNRNGQVTTRLKVFDEGGFQQCSDRTFVMDALVEMRSASINRRLFSPNGDGVTDDLQINYEIDEPITLNINIHPAIQTVNGFETNGVSIKSVVTDSFVLAGAGNEIWNGTNSSGAVVPDGNYAIVFNFKDGCGNIREVTRFVEVDNTPPTVGITYPKAGDPVPMIIEALGTANDVNLQGYTLDFGVGLSPESWVPLGNGSANKISEVLGVWNTFGLVGDHAIRLTANDRAGNTNEIIVPINLVERTNLISYLEAVQPLFSPNGDGTKDSTSIRFGVDADVNLSLDILASTGAKVRTLVPTTGFSQSAQTKIWDSNNDSGVKLTDGIYTARLTASLASNPALKQEEEVTVVVDSTPPTVDITRPVNGFVKAAGSIIGTLNDTNMKSYTVELTDTPSAPVWQELRSDTKGVVNAVLGSLNGLAEGQYALRATAMDLGDITTQKIIPFEIDNTPPNVDITAPVDGAVLGAKKAPVEVKGLVEEKNINLYVLDIGSGDNPTTWTELINGTTLPVVDPLTTLDVASLADGVYTLRLTATDKADNISEKRIKITIDNTLPTTVITVPVENGFVTGPMSITGTAIDTNFAEYRLFVGVGPKDTVSRYTEIGSGITAVDNASLLNWQALPPDGIHTLRLEVTDLADNVAETLVTINVDTTPPTKPIGLAADVLNKQDVNLTWTANTEPDLIGYHVFRDGVQLTTSPVPSPVYLDANVAQGTYLYTVTAIDRAGLESKPSDPAEVAIDITPPTTNIFSPADGKVVNGVVDIRGTAFSVDDFKEYRVFIGDGATPTVWQLLRQSPVPTLADVLAQWNTLVLPEGAVFSIKLEAEDINGNIGTDQVTVSVDNMPPAVPTGLVAVPNGSDVNLTWNANTEPDLLGYLVFRNDRIANATGVVVGDLKPFAVINNAFPDLSLPDGPFIYTVVAIDKAGNTSDPSIPSEVLIDTRAPQAIITVPTDGTRFEAPQFVVATSEDTDIAQVVFEYRLVGTTPWLPIETDTTAPYETFFDTIALGLGFGDYELRAVATDNGAKTDPAPASITVTFIDLTRPTQVIGLVTPVNGGDVSLSWTANTETDIAGYHIDRTDENNVTTRITTALVTTNTFVDAGIVDGNYRYTVVAVDTSDNEGDPSGESEAIVYTPVLDQPFTPTKATLVTLSGEGIGSATVSGEVVTTSGTTSLPSASTDVDNRFVIADVALETGNNEFTVRLTDSAGNISKDATVIVVQGQAPSQPTGLTAAAAGFDVSLTWNANPETDIVGYRIFRNGESLLPDVPVTGITATASDNPTIAFRAVDNSTGTFWPTNNSTIKPAAGQWLAVTLPTPQLVSQLSIQWWNATYRAVDYDIEAWTGTAWIKVAEVLGNEAQINTVSLPQPYRTTQLRVVIRQGNLPDINFAAVRLAEIDVMALMLEPTTAFTDIAPDGIQDYTVTAVNTLGFESIPSDPAQVPVGDVDPPAPVTLSATVAASDVILSWTASTSTDVARYDIFRDGNLVGNQVNLASLTFTDNGVPNGTYIYTVKAVDNVGNASAPSNDAQAIVSITPPTSPVSLIVTAVPTGGELALAWQPPTGSTPTAYRLLRSTTSGGPYTVITDVATTTFNDAGLTNGTTYFYVVLALDAIGNVSTNSNEASGTPVDTIAPDVTLHFPTVPGNLFITKEPLVTVAGTTEAGASVTLNQNGVDITTVQALVDRQLTTQSLNSNFTNTPMSPDGQFVVLTRFGDLTMVNLDTKVELVIDNIGNFFTNPYPSWTFDGTRILFTAIDATTNNRLIREYKVKDGTLRDLTPVDGSTNVTSALMSPDNQQLIVLGIRNGLSGIWHLDLGTNVWTQLVSGSTGNFLADSFEWSPDGSKVTYLRTSSPRSYEFVDITTDVVEVIETQAGNSRPHWSPDGNAIIYSAFRGGIEQIIQYSLINKIAEAIITGPEQLIDPAFSPDGGRIIYVANSNQLLVRDMVTGESQEIATGSFIGQRTTQWVNSGYMSALIDNVFNRILLSGHFEFNNISLNQGDNVFSAMASDDVGNAGSASDSIVVNFNTSDRPDLSVTEQDIIVVPAAPLTGETARVNVVVRNLGGSDSPASSVLLLAIDPIGNSTTLLSGQNIGVIPGGGSQTLSADWTLGNEIGKYSLVAFIDQFDVLAEISEANNFALRELLIAGEAKPQLALATDKFSYINNEDVNGTVDITNSGGTFTGRLEVSVEDTNGILVSRIFTKNINGIEFAQSLMERVTWNTGATFAGAYQLHARLFTPDNTLISESTTGFTISAVAGLTSRIATNQATFSANSNVQVTGTVDYTNGNSIFSGAIATMRIKDSAGTVVAERNKDVTSLSPGSSISLALNWNTGSSQVGQYPVTLKVVKDAQVVTMANTSISITSGVAELNGSVQLSTLAPAVGMPQTVSYQIQNLSNSALNQLPIIISLIDPDLQKTLQTFETVQDIAVDGQAQGSTIFDTIGLSLKTYTVLLQVDVTQSDGTISRSTLATANFRVADRSPPNVELRQPLNADFIRGDATASVFAVDTLTSIDKVEISIDSGQWIPAVISDVTQSLYSSVLQSLAEGTHTIAARAIDAVGNTGTTAALSFIVDNTPPVVTVTGVNNGDVVNTDVTPVITFSDDNLSQTLNTLNGSDFIPKVITAEDSYQLTAFASDSAGNTTQVDVAFIIDKTAPSITIKGIAQDDLVNTDVIPEIIITDDNLKSQTITLNGTPFTSLTTITDDGTYKLEVLADDNAGNTSNATVDFIIDKTLPTVVVTNPPDGTTLDVEMSDISGQTEAQSTVFLKTGTTQLSVLADAAGLFTFSNVPLIEGDNEISLNAKDRAGNTGPTILHRIIVELNKVELIGEVSSASGVLVWLPKNEKDDDDNDNNNNNGKDDDDDAESNNTRFDRMTTLLNAIFTREGVDNLIVTNESDFITALRSQRYGTLVLADLDNSVACDDDDDKDDDKKENGNCKGSDDQGRGTRLKMRSETRREIRAIVASGSGLVWIKTHPDNSEKWEDVVGAKLRGKIPNITSVVLEDSPASQANTWATQDNGHKVEVTSGLAVGSLMPADSAPALILNAYSQGKVALMTFDPSAIVDSNGAMDVLWNVIKFAQPSRVALLPGDSADMSWTVSNVNPPLDSQLTAQLADGMQYIIVLDGEVTAIDLATWNKLIENDQHTFRSVIKLAQEKGAHLITAKIARLENGFPFEIANADLEVVIEKDIDDFGIDLMDSMMNLTVPAEDDEDLQEVIVLIQTAITSPRTSREEIEAIIKSLLKAYKKLLSLETNVPDIEAQFGLLLRNYQILWVQSQ